MLVTNRVTADYPTLVSDTNHTITQLESWLARSPFHVKSSQVKNVLNDIPSYLSKHKALVEGTVVTGGKIAAEFFGGLVLMLFVTFFLIKDGERIWNWLLGAIRRTETARKMDRAGRAAWLSVVYYMRGTVAVAAIHAIVIGLALWIMGAPLVIPLAVLIFLAAFVPLVGLLVAGAVAIVVTLAAKGWVDAVTGPASCRRGPAGGAPVPAAGGRPGHPAAPARGHPLARRGRRARRAYPVPWWPCPWSPATTRALPGIAPRRQ